MRKFRFFIDINKEERYLDDMAKKGYMLNNYSFFGVHTFIKVTPKDLHYKIDYRMFKKKEFEQYKALFEDTGWVHVCGSKYSGAQFFLPSSSNLDCPDIFSDAESKAARYKRMKNQCVTFLILGIIYTFSIFNASGFDLSRLGYRTPGLWERTGVSFWGGLLFETPIAVLRLLPYIFFPVFTVMYGYCLYRAHKLYKKSLRGDGNSCL